MTKEELMALLLDPSKTGLAVDELHRLVEEYPYFHTGHQLYLKGLQQTDGQKMAAQLKVTALSVRDRDVLYQYIYRPSYKFEIHEIQRIAPIPPEPKQLPSPELPNTDDHVITDQNILNHDQLMDVIRLQTDQINPPQTVEEKQPSSETIPIDNHETAENVVDNSPVEIREVYSEKQLVADLLRITQMRTDSSVTSQNEMAAKDIAPEIIPEEKPKEKPDIEPKKDVTEKEKTVWTNRELIDFFLKSNQRIVPNESQFEVNLSESLHEDQEIATETLADIHSMQGHLDKAIEIYEQLILKYPEKRRYFAAQIDRLKNI